MKLKSTFCMLIMMSIVNLASGQNIFNAIANGNLESVRKILENDPALLESKQENEMTPLMFAASQGKIDIVRYLIENGADINYIKSDGPSSLLFAAMFRHEDVVRLLVENGAEVNSGNGQDAPIFKAIEYGTKEIAEYLVEKGADVPVSNFLLHQAAAGGMSKIVDHMIHKDVDIYSMNANGGTLLHSASRGGLLNLAKQMISKGAEIDQRNRYGITPLHIASSQGHIDLVEFLIHRGANIHIKTYSGLSSFALAESFVTSWA